MSNWIGHCSHLFNPLVLEKLEALTYPFPGGDAGIRENGGPHTWLRISPFLYALRDLERRRRNEETLTYFNGICAGLLLVQ